jgi:citrate lyase subunit beta/citryl-CoA lyase
MLFVPGNRGKWVAPARESGTDAILFDLEDAVPVAELPEARAVVGRTLDEAASGISPRVLVRVGPPGTPNQDDDLDAVVRPGLTAVVIPLVTDADEVRAVADRIDKLEETAGMEHGSVAIMPLVETAKAARFSYEIASSSPRVAYMGGGTSRAGDIARSLGYRWSPEGTETYGTRSWVLLNVRAAGVPYPVTGVWGQVGDLDGMRFFAEQSRDIGYNGLMLIHPSHVAIANEVFTPTAQEVADWHEVIRVMREAQANGVGAIRHLGMLVDEADVKTAELGLALAEALGIGGTGE